MLNNADQAWNNFVTLSEPSSYEPGSSKRAAAISASFMGLANNGGLNSFLTTSYDLDAREVLEALTSVGALEAAKQLARVLKGLGIALDASSQDERWNLLDSYWTEQLDPLDTLSSEADEELMRVLERHVSENVSFYLGLGEEAS